MGERSHPSESGTIPYKIKAHNPITYDQGCQKYPYPWISADKTRNGQKTDVKNGYPLPASTSIFDTRILIGWVQYHSIRTRGYPYPLHFNSQKYPHIIYIHMYIYIYIYIYICIHQSWPYQHLSTLKHPILTIYLQLHTSNSNLHLSKFQLNHTVNEPQNAVLQKLRRLEKLVAPNTQKSGTWRLTV